MSDATESKTAQGWPLLVGCAPGLEPLVTAEIRSLTGIEAVEPRTAAVALRGDLQTVMRLNLHLGMALRVWVQVADRQVSAKQRLEVKAQSIPWNQWIGSDADLKLSIRSTRSVATPPSGAEERVRQAIGERIGGFRSRDETRPARLRLSMDRDRVRFWVDTSGEPLHKRGYRKETAKAPLREDIAHALLAISQWDRDSSLVDPMMGAGTILIEGARMARHKAPGIDRSFAFEHFPRFERADWEALREEATAAELASKGSFFYGSDRDAGAVEITRRNAERAGVAEDLSLSHAAISAAPFRAQLHAARDNLGERGALVTNPPWGGRLGKGSDLRPLYQTLGKLAAEVPSAWSVAFVATQERLAGQVAGARPALSTSQGGRDITFYTTRAR